MRKTSALILALAATLVMAAAAFAEAPFHIGIATLTVSQAEDTYRGAERMIQEYGDVADGGMVQHVTMPDNFMSEMETTISQIVGLADDPKMKVIVVDDAIPGTTEAFRRVKEKRPDILCFAGQPQEDPGVISGRPGSHFERSRPLRQRRLRGARLPHGRHSEEARREEIRSHLLPAPYEL